MDKPAAYDETIKNVLDYVDAKEYIDSVLGYDQRDAQVRFPEQGSYLDYWHYVIEELFDEAFTNDSFVRHGPFSFKEFYIRTMDKYDEYPGEYHIWMSW
jgi:hypothetical protein